MKVFIGWSGSRSKVVALALREWLPRVIQAVTPWMSEEDIHAGSVWGSELSGQLEETNFGIIALTQENLGAPWINFEAGALSKKVGKAAVCPYLIDIAESTEVVGPLDQFQSKKATKDGTQALLKEVNRHVGDSKLSEQILASTFERWWPDLETAINNLPPVAPIKPTRTDRDLLEEILERVRSLGRQTSARQQTYWTPDMLAEAKALDELVSDMGLEKEFNLFKHLKGTPEGNLSRAFVAKFVRDLAEREARPSKPERKKNTEEDQND